MPLSASEAKRKITHIGVGGIAFLLRFLTWEQAALIALGALAFNAFVLPRIGGKSMWREAEHGRGYPLGILLYPAAVLALVLVFHDRLEIAAALWGILAFGDGMASLVGQGAGGPRLPWNDRKSWSGFVAFVVCGAIGASVLMAWTLGLPLSS
jgi:phytol kinase